MRSPDIVATLALAGLSTSSIISHDPAPTGSLTPPEAPGRPELSQRGFIDRLHELLEGVVEEGGDVAVDIVSIIFRDDDGTTVTSTVTGKHTVTAPGTLTTVTAPGTLSTVTRTLDSETTDGPVTLTTTGPQEIVTTTVTTVPVRARQTTTA